ncbi:hypothetical protein EZ313_11555 [Ramlibacter henchirensis]|uniref:Lipoprotein n=1 Tax=Ramlibacter henchirensis TaxID=204072 RepID=A0A4Z0CAV4_9BURK|nr:hypothetical protein [Ramlibacter henchirensis]TFZ07209.1 hypothetical protein EZ313_11555 [Ramlibacter henchirensis]
MKQKEGERRGACALRLAISAVLLAALAACGGGGGGNSGPGGAGSGAALSLGAADNPQGIAAAGQPSASASQLQPGDFTLNTTTAGDQGRAAAAALPGGGFVAVWSTFDGSVGDVRLQRFGSGGEPAGAETVVATSGHSPGVTLLADGGFLVSWSASPFMYEANGHVQRFDAQGAPVGGPMQLATTFFKYLAKPLGLPDGSFVLAVDTMAGRFGPEHGLVGRHAADGTALGTPVRLASQLTRQTGALDPNWAGSTTAARWPDGRFAVAWLAGGTGVSEVRLTRFDALGNEAGTSVVAKEPSLRHPALAVLDGGGFALAWVSGAVDGPKTLWLEVFGADGASLGRQAAASDMQATEVVPRIAALDSGGFVLGWKAASFDANALNRTVSVQRFGAAGQALGAVEQIGAISAPLSATGYDSDTLDVVGGRGGSFLVLHGGYSDAGGWDVRASARR